MSFFSKILEKLGLGKKDEPAAPAAPAPKPMAGKPYADKADRDAAAGKAAASWPGKPTGPAVAPMSEVDVVKKLEKMAEAEGSGLNWKASIVDLLKILGIDSGKEARIELAKELGCPADLIGGDYSKMNVWLHKEVLRRIAQNGGNIPASMLD
ncbi:MAG: DUF3597 domain-containing protein [Chloroflexota bacterium]